MRVLLSQENRSLFQKGCHLLSNSSGLDTGKKPKEREESENKETNSPLSFAVKCFPYLK